MRTPELFGGYPKDASPKLTKYRQFDTHPAQDKPHKTWGIAMLGITQDTNIELAMDGPVYANMGSTQPNGLRHTPKRTFKSPCLLYHHCQLVTSPLSCHYTCRLVHVVEFRIQQCDPINCVVLLVTRLSGKLDLVKRPGEGRELAERRDQLWEAFQLYRPDLFNGSIQPRRLDLLLDNVPSGKGAITFHDRHKQ